MDIDMGSENAMDVNEEFNTGYSDIVDMPMDVNEFTEISEQTEYSDIVDMVMDVDFDDVDFDNFINIMYEWMEEPVQTVWLVTLVTNIPPQTTMCAN